MESGVEGAADGDGSGVSRRVFMDDLGGVLRPRLFVIVFPLFSPEVGEEVFSLPCESELGSCLPFVAVGVGVVAPAGSLFSFSASGSSKSAGWSPLHPPSQKAFQRLIEPIPIAHLRTISHVLSHSASTTRRRVAQTLRTCWVC